MKTLKTVEDVTNTIYEKLYPKSSCGCGGYLDFPETENGINQALTQHTEDIIEMVENAKEVINQNDSNMIWALKSELNKKLTDIQTKLQETLSKEI